LIYGYFTLLLGAKLPAHLRPAILGAAEWKHEEGYWLNPNFVLERKFYLEDFSCKIRDYRPGKPVHLVRLKNFEDDIKFGAVGLKQFWDYVKSGKIFSVPHINLDSCDLEEIPAPIFDLKNLKTLSLEHNNINFLPKKIGDLVLLEELFLNDNKIETLPESIGKLTSLRMLYLNNNNLLRLPDSIGNLSSLDILVLSDNFLEDLPKTILNLKNLSVIYIENNQIKEIPTFLKKTSIYIVLKKSKYLH
jgi:Leucine-rich repeat (LRR) protein